VLVIRLVCPSTIDAVVAARAQKKRELADAIDRGRGAEMEEEPKLSSKDMLQLLS